MTRREYSDSTLTQLRLDFMDETRIFDGGLAPGLTTHTPPISRRVEEGKGGRYEVVEEKEPADQIGESLSAIMVALIGNITADLNFYSPRHPVRRALAEWERTCRRRHRGSQWWDHASAPICGDMLRQVIEGGATVRWCAEFTGIPYPRAERLIASGAAFVQERLSRWEDEKLGIVHDREHCAVCREEAG